MIRPKRTDPHGTTASISDGAMSILIGIGIESGIVPNMGDLTDLTPKKVCS